MEMKLGSDFENLSSFKKILLLLLPPIAIVAIFTTIFILPYMEGREKLKSEIDAQNNDINQLKKYSEKLPTLISENERLQKRLSELQMQLPEEKDVSGLLRHVSMLGIQSGLDIDLWKPKARTVHQTKQIYEIPVEVQMRGSYHNFGNFFGNLTKLGRVVNLDVFDIKTLDSKLQKPGKELRASFTVQTYSVISDEEKKKFEAEEKAKEKK